MKRKNRTKKAWPFKILIFYLLMVSCNLEKGKELRELTEFVNPRIGADLTSNNSIGPQMPWGSVQPGPDTYFVNFAGYREDQPIRGFSQLRLTGGGGPPGYGNFLISPQIGLAVGEEEHDSQKSDENPTCTSYSVKLDRYDITAELTPANHAVLYRFSFPESDSSHILIDLGHYLAVDGLRPANRWWLRENMGLQKGNVTLDPDHRTIKGWGTYSGGYHDNYTVYFCARFNKQPMGSGTWKNDEISENNLSQDGINKSDRIGGYFHYNTDEKEQLLMKIGVSFQSMENAEKFVDEEIAGFDYEQVQEKCKNTWNRYLSTFLIDDPNITHDEKVKFYTAAWRTAHQPHNRTGDSPLWNTDDPYWDDQFCTWDSWRTLYPLYSLVKPSITRDNIKCYIKRRSIGHFVGDAFLSGHDSNGGQGGDDVDNVIADAFSKGLSGIDWEAAYEVMKNHADNGRLVNDGGNGSVYREQGWVPAPIWCSVSKTLEFAYNDFLIAQMAKALDKTDDYENYISRAQKWVTLWDPEAESFGFKGFMHTKNADGSWAPFDPTDGKYPGNSRWEGYYEGQSWIYSYFVPHDFARLIEMMGGKNRFIERLKFGLSEINSNERLLNASNEPGFLIAMLFHYAGYPELTSAFVRDYELPTFTMENYGGQEDQGALSARYIWLISGLSPIAGQNVYLLHGPRYKKMTIQMENNTNLEIIGNNVSEKNKYIQSVKLDGKSWNKSWLSHEDIDDGGKLVFEMGPDPSDWAESGELPPSLSTGGF